MLDFRILQLASAGVWSDKNQSGHIIKHRFQVQKMNCGCVAGRTGVKNIKKHEKTTIF